MSNLLANWWRSQKFITALKQGDNRLAKKLLKQIEKSRANLSWQEKLFRDKLQLEELLDDKNERIREVDCRVQELELQLGFGQFDDFKKQIDDLNLIPDPKFIEFIVSSFNLIEHDQNLVQCTGIDDRVFDDFEANLAEYIKEEFKHHSWQKKLNILVKEAVDDINKLKIGQDPEYRFELSPHIYLIRYFLDNVYCAYLAWFFIYKSGLLPTQVNILDIAAGPGTAAYGLALLLQSTSGFFAMPSMHISYYSLEQQKAFQYRGLQFWRQYMEPLAMNAYFRFDTANIFDYDNNYRRLPKKFFDFIVISHCFFSDGDKRRESSRVFNEICTNSLKESSYVLLIIQDKKLFKPYNIRQDDDEMQELSVVTRFIEELGLKLVWYKYLSSTGKRTSISDFGKFARENLYAQRYMSPLARKYLGLNFDFHYGLDDYVILAKR
ncbi:photosystem II assembly protein [Kamptonema sp. UHCC 0994]|uniref:photosystem II assembly protein n=1 Tax=Kamptonema sp. UHCC 0994 TaxID=3031329 RepID=UPI0023B93504|nr:photosystem II assembly protein [Kamptonema sp. UHCC 0994]MDF0555150.1 photosystem II assembly protein [Kamptonema sp. UHCC 0994]